MNQIAGSLFCILFVASLSSCGSGSTDKSASDFENFHECLARSSINDDQIAKGVRESCMQKFEQLSQKLKGMNVSANLYGPSGLYDVQVNFTNPYDEVVITKIEIEFKTPQDRDSPSCESQPENCRSLFTSGRAWILPDETGSALVAIPRNSILSNRTGEPTWSFEVESVRYLRFASE